MRLINIGYNVDGSVMYTPASNTSSCSSLLAHAERILLGEQPVIEKI